METAPLLAADQEEDDVDHRLGSAPPPYPVHSVTPLMVWSNPQPIGTNLMPGSVEAFSPTTHLPRRVVIARGQTGFGLTLRPGGRGPVVVAELDADSGARGLLFVGDELLEVNHTSVLTADVDRVATLLQRGGSSAALLVLTSSMSPESPAVPSALDRSLWVAALSSLGTVPHSGPSANAPESAAGTADVSIDAIPPSHFGLSVGAAVCCPVLGIAAFWYGRQVAGLWRARAFERARAHAAVAHKLAVSAYFYGALMILLLVVWLAKPPHNDHGL